MNIKLKNILNEAKGYYIKVSPRDAKKALSILDKMYRRKFDISGSDTYYFKDESMAYDATMDLVTQDIEVVDSRENPIENAQVSLLIDGNNIASNLFTNALGQAAFNLDPTESSDMTITVTKLDHKPYQSSISNSNENINIILIIVKIYKLMMEMMG